MNTKIVAVCKECGSEAVVADAYAVWSVETQQWEVGDVYDKGAFCHDCDGETRIVFMDVP
jgi:hypothetical protein